MIEERALAESPTQKPSHLSFLPKAYPVCIAMASRELRLASQSCHIHKAGMLYSTVMRAAFRLLSVIRSSAQLTGTLSSR